MDLAGELAVGQARLMQAARTKNAAAFLQVAEEIEQLSLQLRNQVLDLRLLPFQVSFPKYRRLVRDVAAKENKQVELVLQGEDTELDKAVIEGLNGPLIHLLRNAIDHGVEKSSVRLAMGKPPQGTITVSARQTGAEIMILVKDDGAGVNCEAVRQKAVRMGLAAPDQQLSRKELLELIFHPGLSTAARTDEVSGRGVGMDAVREGVAALRGSIAVESEPGKGCAFHIRLPLSLAIIDSLQVRVAEDIYYIHLDHVEECVEMRRHGREFREGKTTIGLRGKVLPVLCLRDFFQHPPGGPDLAQVVIVRAGDHRCGLLVDEVIDQQQAVFKDLGAVYGKVEGVLGATVTEHGFMALILDVPGVVRSFLAAAT